MHVAYHEAGHALLWMLQGVPFEEAALAPEDAPPDHHLGWTAGFYPIPDAPPVQREAARLGLLAIHYGGLMGETQSPHRDTFQWEQGCRTDLKQMDTLLTQWYPDNSDKREAMRQEAMQEAVHLWTTCYSEDTIATWLKRLAAALLRQGKLTYDQATDAINTELQEGDPPMGLFNRTPAQDPQEDPQQDPQASGQDTQEPAAPAPADKAAIKAQERRERRAEQAQRWQARQAERQQRHQERRETMHALANRAETWWHNWHAPKPELSPLEKYRARIDSFEEDRETLPEKLVRWVLMGFAYMLPFVVALAIGKEIGDAYSGTTDYWASGWSIGTHTVAYGGEISLAMMVLSTATAFRRYKADNGYTAKLVSSVFFFMLFVTASSLAQWFIAEQHIHPKTNADLAALIFRVAMPPAVDVASMLYLAIMGYKSLKKFLTEQSQKAEAIKRLNEAELTIQAAQQEAERRQKESEQWLVQKQRREDLLLRIEEIHSQAMIDTAQRALLPGRPAPVRIEEDGAAATPPLQQLRSQGPAITGAFQEFSAEHQGPSNNGRHLF